MKSISHEAYSIAAELSNGHIKSYSTNAALVINPIRKAKHAKDSDFLLEVPHLGDDGMEALFPNGYSAKQIPAHRIYDPYVGRLAVALAKRKVSLIGSVKSRLAVNYAVPESIAVQQHTPDGFAIPAYRGEDFGTKKAEALFLHHSYNATLASMRRFGGKYRGTLDSMDPESLNGDNVDLRDMAISIIAKNPQSPRALELQRRFTKTLQKHLGKIQKSTDYPINFDRPVTINEPYGAQVIDRLDLFRKAKESEEVFVFEVRSDILKSQKLVEIIADVLHDGIKASFAMKPEQLLRLAPQLERRKAKHYVAPAHDKLRDKIQELQLV